MNAIRSLYEARRFDDAHAEYQRLNREGSVDAETHLYGALSARQRGDLPGARWAIERAAKGERLEGRLLGQVRFMYGTIARELGDYGTAIDLLGQFLHDMEQYADLSAVMTGAAMFNLGQAYRGANRLTDAYDAFAGAASEFRKEAMAQSLHMALVNFAWAACLLNKRAEARQAIDEAEPYASTTEAKLQQRLGEAHVLYVEGRKHDATRICHELITAGESVPSEVRSQACWLAGVIALALDQIEMAETLAEEAVALAQKAKVPRFLRDAAELLRAIRIARSGNIAGG